MILVRCILQSGLHGFQSKLHIHMIMLIGLGFNSDSLHILIPQYIYIYIYIYVGGSIKNGILCTFDQN